MSWEVLIFNGNSKEIRQRWRAGINVTVLDFCE